MPHDSPAPIHIGDGRLFSALSAREWLLADGRGGYSLGTHAGLNTRKYHGLLIVSLRPPIGRVLLVSRLEETVVDGDVRVPLDIGCYEPGILHPEGYRSLADFSRAPDPTWTFRAAGRQIRRTLSRRAEGGVTVRWELVDGDPVALHVRPLLTRRSHHGVGRVQEFEPQVTAEAGRIAWRPRPDAPATHLTFNGTLSDDAAYFYRDVLYGVERERGYEAVEDLHGPCMIRFELAVGLAGELSAAAEDEPVRPPATIERPAPPRVDKHVNDAAKEALLVAADQFLIRGADGAAGIVAGYPWFEEWGRDTMIALPGLCLSTGRFDLAFRILENWAARLQRGLLPTRLGDQHAIENNSADAPLLFVRAVELLDRARWDRRRVEKAFRDAIYAILDAYHDGTDHGICVDHDGLLKAGAPGLALTWMDAIVDGVPVTPRRGKTIELNALYLEALGYGADLCDRNGDDERAATYRARGAGLESAMRDRFLDPATGLIRDVVDGDGDGDPDAFRANILFAIAAESQPFRMVDAERNLAKVELDLLTPFGLRTLAPDHPSYVATYRGDQRTRDLAYHQGTVWPWLIGVYADALVRVHGDRQRTRDRIGAALAPLLRYVVDYGTLPEVFDGEHPHGAGGCPAQAWSVSEVLRVLTFLES